MQVKFDLIEVASLASGHSIGSTILEDPRQGLGEAAPGLPRLQSIFAFASFYASKWQSLQSSQRDIIADCQTGLSVYRGPCNPARCR